MSMYFSYDPSEGIEFHDTAEEAKARAVEALDWARFSAADSDWVWNDNEDEICWGEVQGRAFPNERPPTDEERAEHPEWSFVREVALRDFLEEKRELEAKEREDDRMLAEGLQREAEAEADWLIGEAKHAESNPPRPHVVCLCGSTRFRADFDGFNERETLAGHIVLAPGCWSRSTPEEAARGIFRGCTEGQKFALDELHKRKIDMADEILVINVGGYIGDSTGSEIDYAKSTGKPVRYIEPVY